jgi:Secretion system C-terminal sorting domain/Beta-propeller repeat
MKQLIISALLSLLFSSIIAQTPSLDWTKSIGGTGIESGYNNIIDINGNLYTIGSFQDTVDFDPSAGVFNLISAGGDDIFIQKLDANGNFVWAKNMGGTGNNLGRSITLDGSGNIYITGYFQNTVDFDPSATIFNLVSAGGNDIFIEKLDTNGNFIWAKSMGSTGSDQCVAITSDASGNVYTTGTFQNTVDFDPGTGTSNLVSNGGNDIYIQKLDANGNFMWANNIGGLGLDWGYSITTDNIGGFYITGIFQNTIDFDPGAGTFNLTAIGGLDSYVEKFDANGNFIWAKSIGGTGTVISYSITTDGSANVYTTGFFQNTIDFDPGAGTLNLTSAGNDDAFIQKLDGDGNFIWAKSFGAADNDRSFSITTDGSDNIYTTGSYINSVDFDPNAGTFNLTSSGTDDIFIQKLDADGNFVWANTLGGSLTDIGLSIKVDNFNNLYTTGSFQGTADLDPTTGVSNFVSAGGDDIFSVKLKQCLPVNGNDVRTECDSLLWIDGITYYSNNNTATFNIIGGAANTCDSLVTLDLTIINSATGTDTRTECDSITWLDGITYYSNNNTATFNIIGGAANTCDSLVTLDLTIINSATGIDTRTECDSLLWIDGITYYSNNNVATFNIVGGAANNCDSLVTLNLTISDSSSNRIEGVVYYQGIPITSGEVNLYRKNGNTPQDIIKVDSLQLSGSGFYYFDGVAPGGYLVKALGDTILYDNVSTYADSTNHWQWAPIKTISFGCNDTLFNVDINLRDYPLNTGLGSISGTIQENLDPLFKAPGDPIGDIDITVEQSPDGAVSGFDISDLNGEFNFNNLPAGNYYIYADIPGYICDTTYLFNFDGSGLNYDVTLCVYDTLNTISICNDVVTSINKSLIIDNFIIYPNPTQDIINISSRKTNDYTIEILDLNGRTLFTEKSIDFIKEINLSSFKKGLYIISIKSNTGKFVYKISVL